MKIKTIIHNSKEGGYWAEIPAMPGCVTQGETMNEVKKNVIDAIEGWMKVNELKIIKKACKFRDVRIISVLI